MVSFPSLPLPSRLYSLPEPSPPLPPRMTSPPLPVLAPPPLPPLPSPDPPPEPPPSRLGEFSIVLSLQPCRRLRYSRYFCRWLATFSRVKPWTPMRSRMRLGTALSMPSWLTAVTNCWCSSALQTTRGFFSALLSSSFSSPPLPSLFSSSPLTSLFLLLPFLRLELPPLPPALPVLSFVLPPCSSEEPLLSLPPPSPVLPPLTVRPFAPAPSLRLPCEDSRLRRTTCCQMLRSSSILTGFKR
mmetsp:Transcript_6036/g.27059  ORF Transcript_6036/g.27059 Transcript_6036/m.27059 type:complete len:242 (+) Transcript_6036:764-1489(+)